MGRGSKPGERRGGRKKGSTNAPKRSTPRGDLSPKVVEALLTRMVDGESIRQICRDPKMPGRTKIFKELGQNPAFANLYTRARELQMEAFAEEILEIADDGSNDWMEKEREDGEKYTVVDHEHISRSKLRVEARKWLMAKMAPRKYGDRVTTEVSGPDGGPILTKDVSPRDRAKALHALLAKIKAEG